MTLVITFSPTWDTLPGKPASFTPAAHTHATSEVTGLDSSLSTLTTAASNASSAAAAAQATADAAIPQTAEITAIEVVASLPGSPDATTLYIVTG